MSRVKSIAVMETVDGFELSTYLCVIEQIDSVTDDDALTSTSYFAVGTMRFFLF